MREICTSGSTRGEWVVKLFVIAHSPTLLAMGWFLSSLLELTADLGHTGETSD
jgi:hypothetical protein